MSLVEATVFIVDDDPSICAALARLFKSVGLPARSFTSAREFLDQAPQLGPGCLVLDMRLSGLSGLDLQGELARAGIDLPIIFLTAHGSVPLSVKAMKAGAVDFLEKPVEDQSLLDAVYQALERDRQARRAQAQRQSLQELFATLTPRERQVTGVYIGASGAIQVSSIGIGGFSYGGAGGEGKEESSGHVTGGTGGTGGAGGSVQITNNGPITTAGASTSYGIYGQSVGGAGGKGGEADAHGTQGFGGTGGAGGAGGSVTVTNNAAIKTGSYLGAYGINAMSSGGSGGQGGEGKNGPQSNGGDGGNGGKAGAVTVNCNAAIDTAGLALAVNAASTGGNGGGGSNNGNEGTADNGMGGNGGGSGLVSVNVAPGITLTGGIAAASIAGAGGTGSEGKDYGGPGGSGGVSGGVKVDCQGDIDLFTNICGINGILAQSISGAGGAGGNAGHHPGSAGLSGAGGDVTVNLGGSIQTDGDCSYGILAQSIGGGGAGGGSVAASMSFSGSGSCSMDCPIAIGGDGGPGGAAGWVEVTNQNAIQTSGYNSLGIMAQSISGGGGDGGSSLTGALSGSAGSVNFSPQVTIGGDGGDGSAGNTVTITNTGAITTTGVSAIGIEAQSVGGTGGNGNGAFAGNVLLGSSTGFNANVTVGGTGGKGGAGGNVTVTNGDPLDALIGTINTSGHLAPGIMAQSIGGGGGNGGGVFTLALGPDVTNQEAQNTDPPATNLSGNVTVGGNGGTGGDAGQVKVDNYGAISTQGAYSYGISAQSVGGGGGDGGVPTLGLTVPSGDWSDWQTWLIPSEGLSFEVGGAGGAAGVGNTVTVNNYGVITTSGIGTMGIYAQSVGGGGGVASYDQSNGSSGTGTNLLPGAIRHRWRRRLRWRRRYG